MRIRWLASLLIALVLALPTAVHSTASVPTSSGPSSSPFTFSHIYVIMEENTNYEDLIGNTADVPYINYLANTYSFAANYYGVTHPSEPNYLAITGGDFYGLHADDPSFRTDAKNIVDQLEAAGKTWATYQESMPSVGYLGDQYPTTGTGLYVAKHNPFVLFNDIRNNPKRLQNVKPMEDLATDLNSGKAPNYAFIAPNLCHDFHGVAPPSATAYGYPDCGYPAGNFTINHALFQAGDAYLKQLVTTIMSSKGWTSDSVIAVTWDENESSALSSPNRGYASSTGCCGSPIGEGGGRVPTILITNTPLHTVSLHPYNHYSLLRTIEDNFGVGCLANTCDPTVQAMTDLLPPTGKTVPLSFTQGFAVTFYSKNPGQGYVLFGPSCSALVETATRDLGAGTTTHTVLVQGNDLPGTVGDIGITPGATYYYEVETVGPNGTEIDNNNGKCYVQSITKT